MRKAFDVALGFLTVLTCTCSLRAQVASWKTFVSRGGWTIQYPGAWKTGGCHTCLDSTAKGIYVDFFPSTERDRDRGSWVMVESLAAKPTGIAAENWLEQTSTSANQNARISESRLTVGGDPALQVRYRTNQGTFMDEVYVVSGSRTFSIAFIGEGDLQPEKYATYRVFEQMIKSFRVRVR